jgi:hypothetical protein
MQPDQDMNEMEGKILLLENKKFVFFVGFIALYYIAFLAFLTCKILQSGGLHY